MCPDDFIRIFLFLEGEIGRKYAGSERGSREARFSSGQFNWLPLRDMIVARGVRADAVVKPVSKNP